MNRKEKSILILALCFLVTIIIGKAILIVDNIDLVNWLVIFAELALGLVIIYALYYIFSIYNHTDPVKEKKQTISAKDPNEKLVAFLTAEEDDGSDWEVIGASEAETTESVDSKSATGTVTTETAETVENVKAELVEEKTEESEEVVANEHELNQIVGVTTNAATSLNNEGINSSLDLVGLTGTELKSLSEKTGLDYNQLKEWQEQADILQVDTVTPQDASALNKIGVDSTAELAQRSPSNLHEKLQSYSEEHKELAYRVPTDEECSVWVKLAQKLSQLLKKGVKPKRVKSKVKKWYARVKCIDRKSKAMPVYQEMYKIALALAESIKYYDYGVEFLGKPDLGGDLTYVVEKPKKTVKLGVYSEGFSDLEKHPYWDLVPQLIDQVKKIMFDETI